MNKIGQLENSAKKRESDMKHLLASIKSRFQLDFEQEKSQLLAIISKKDAEIRGFKSEMDRLVISLMELKRHKM